MADTSRTKADLLTLFPDNFIGAITPQGIRDLVVSALSEFGEIYVAEGVAAQVTTASPQKMSGFAANGISLGITPDHTSDHLTIALDGVYAIDFNCSFGGSASDKFYCAIYINGADAGLARMERVLGVGGDVGSSGTGGILNLSAADTVEIYVWSDTGGVSFVPHQASLRVRRIG